MGQIVRRLGSAESLSGVDLPGLKGRLSADGIISAATEKSVFRLIRRAVLTTCPTRVLFSPLLDADFLDTEAQF